ncbi:MAG: SGNH/GDSL hydrolase family protein [Oscillospiraceae bacterium]|nr:SGNH/GDSL hydrolase family protein [Oscillospiraceae bacterium]
MIFGRKNLLSICFKALAAAAAFILVFAALQRLVTPKYASYAIEGGLLREYYDSSMDHDVIFLGDCEVYANFSTVALWEEYGINSYIRGSPQQLIWHSYYLLEDTLRHAKTPPKVVVLSVMAMQYSEPQHEPYNRLALDGMALSKTKIDAIRSSRMPDEDILSYVFPLLRYKDNWRDIGLEDFQYFFKDPRVSINGFMVRSDTMPAGFIPAPLPRASYDFGEKPLEYLEKITNLCAENDIELVLIKAPVLYPHWFLQWDEQILGFAEENNLIYINFLGYTDVIGLDYSKHTFNAGNHLNIFGAEVLSRYFGKILTDELGLPDHRQNPVLVSIWNDLAREYYALIDLQLSEISTHGEILTFLIK